MPTALPVPNRSAPASRWTLTVFSPALIPGLLRRWSERYRQRCDLGELDDRLLSDIGLTRRQAEEERRKPFWR